MSQLSFLMCVAGMLLSTLAQVAVADSKSIDKRDQSEEAAHYLIFACRENSSTGHAFVVWGRESWEKQASELQAFGFYPREGEKGVVGPVPGRIVDDVVNGSLAKASQLLVVRVNSKVYERAERIRGEWEKKAYQLAESDCVTFLAAIAATVPGLKVPPRDLANLTPADFLKAIVNAN